MVHEWALRGFVQPSLPTFHHAEPLRRLPGVTCQSLFQVFNLFMGTQPTEKSLLADPLVLK